MKRFFKWCAVVILAGWMLFSVAVIALGGFEYVYAFKIAPLFYRPAATSSIVGEETPTGIESSLLPPNKVDKVFRPLDVEESIIPGLVVINEYWSVERVEVVFFTYERKRSLELYITSWDAEKKRSIKKLEIKNLKHRHILD